MTYKTLSGFHSHYMPLSSREVGIWKDCQTQGKIKCKKNPGTLSFCCVCVYCLKINTALTWCNGKNNSDDSEVPPLLFISLCREGSSWMLQYRDVHKTTNDNSKSQVDCVTNLSKTMNGWRYILLNLQSYFQYSSLFPYACIH